VGSFRFLARGPSSDTSALYGLRALSLTAIASLALASQPAFSETTPKTDWLTPGAYSTDAMSQRPEVKEPNMRLQNFLGSTFERRMIRRGAGAAAATAGAVALTAAIPSTSWANTAKRAGAGLAGAAAGFATACAAGAAVGLIGAAVTGGTSIVAGCTAWGFQGAVIGGWIGATTVCVDESCKIKAPTGDAANSGGLTGDGVKGSSASDAAGDTGLIATSCTRYSSLVGCNFGGNLADVYSRIGMNRTFPCTIQGSGLQVSECMFAQAVQPTQTDSQGLATFQFLGGGPPVARNSMKVLFPQMIGAYDTDQRCAGQHCWMVGDALPYISASTFPRSVVVLIGSVQTFADKASVPQQELKIPPNRAAWADLLSDKLDAQTSQLKVSNELLAAMANQALRDAGDTSVDSDPVTPAEIQQLKTARPDLTPTVGDLVRPYDNVGRDPQGASETKPAIAPTPVSIVNNSPTGSTDTVQRTREESDQELDNDPGLIGDIMAPAKDFLANSLGSWMHPNVSLPPVQCPVISIDLPTLLGRQDLSNPADSSIECDWLEQQRPKFLGFLHVVILFLAARRIMQA